VQTFASIIDQDFFVLESRGASRPKRHMSLKAAGDDDDDDDNNNNDDNYDDC